jgi:hypothetical protein
MSIVMRTSEFARRCNVDKSRCEPMAQSRPHRWKRDRGRRALRKIDAAVALKQLKVRLPVDERFGMNGLSTKLDWLPADHADDGAAANDRDDDGTAEADRQRSVTLYDAKAAIDDFWVFMDLRVQVALKPHPEAAAAYQALRPRLADAKWRAQGVGSPR